MSSLMLSLVLLMGFQELPDEPSRTEALEAARQEKASNLTPPSPGPDPIENPEMSTAAEVISTKFFYAVGYNVP